jgi:predicted esterase
MFIKKYILRICYGGFSMLKTRIVIFLSVIICVFLAVTVIAQNESATNASANLATSKVTSPPVSKTAGQSRRAGGDPVDDRVELREYLFTDTNEMLPYAVFVSSKVTKDKKAPIVLALHGMSGNHGTFMRSQCVEEAEKNGFIMIGAMGYSPSGPFGMNFSMGGRGRGTGAPGGRGGAPGAAGRGGMGGAAPSPSGIPGAAMEAATPGGRGGTPGAAGRGMMMSRGRGPAIGGTKETDSAKVAQLSEKDAMNVLEMARKEFNVDDNRIYLMGHSLGGGGALHMGEKYADIWAGVAGCAPAAFGFTWTAESKLKNVPLLLIAGDADTLVSGTKQTYDQLKALNFKVEFKSMPGVDHGGIIGDSMPDVFGFFAKNTKAEAKQDK